VTMLVTIRGIVTVETLPVHASMSRISDKTEGPKAKCEIRGPLNRALTIWLSLHSNSGSGDDRRRGRSRKKGQGRTLSAGSHEIVIRSGTSG